METNAFIVDTKKVKANLTRNYIIIGIGIMNQNNGPKYFQLHYSFMRFIGLGYFHNPKENNFKNFSKPWYVLYSVVQLGFWVFLFTAALWMEVPYIYKNLDRLMLNLTFSVTFSSSFVKIYIVLAHNKTIQKIVYSIEHDLCQFPQNEKIMKKTVTVCRRLTLSILSFANLTVIGLVIGGTVQGLWSQKIFKAKHVNGTETFKPSDRVLPMPVYLPFEITSDYIYAIAFIYQILGIQWYGNIVVLINTFMNTIMVHLAGKFANLKYFVENTREVAIMRLKLKIDAGNSENLILSSEKALTQLQTLGQVDEDEMAESEKIVMAYFTEEEINKEMCIFLKECIKHHISLLSLVETFEDTYSIGFLVHVVNNLNVICHVMIQISENDIFSIRCGTAITLFFTVVSELLVQCYAGNELTLQATGLAQSAYNSQWYTADRTFRRLMTILMMRAQKQVIVTAGKFVAISNSTFVMIMRGAYSFFAVIRSTKGD